MSLTLSIISTNKAFHSLKNEWNTLNDNMQQGSIFTSWEWLYQWWETYYDNGKRQLHILLIKDQDNELVAIAPFQIVNQPKKLFPCSKQIMFLGTGEIETVAVFSENMDILILAGYEESAINLISDYLINEKKQWHAASFPQLLSNSNLSRLFKSHSNVVHKTTRNYGYRSLINLPNTWDDYLMSLNRKTRNAIKRYWKRLKKETNYTIKTLISLPQL